MTCYDAENGVAEYVEMAYGHDGRKLVAVLGEHLPAGASILELGMGPGKDLDLLAQRYEAQSRFRGRRVPKKGRGLGDVDPRAMSADFWHPTR